MKIMEDKPLVGIVMGSSSDIEIMEEAARVLKEFGIPYEMTIASAHRSPKRTSEYAKSAVERGLEVIIAGAGSAAHLAGVIASETILPIIGVPIDSSPLKGLDSLLSTVQMPAGIPVATMAIGKAGAKNAGIFAAEILATKHPEILEKLINYRRRLAENIEKEAKKLET
ncbi:MAG: 5-(carboxyamino)imidazole ribonucleotide mutase [Nitrospirota bacterium]|jgi:phosphoribosylaminoimidazole carboxylase PurE protein